MKILIGGNGKMGALIRQTAQQQGHEVLANVDATCLDQLEGLETADLIIDFSHRDNLNWILDYVDKNNCALVYGTTGLDETQKEQLFACAKKHPVFYSANYSYGVAAFQEILRVAVPLLKEKYDMELVECHHNQKQDAPSGTAKALLEIMNPNGEFKEVYGREGMVGARQKEIGVHALRGGTEAGEHVVHFFGDNESITLEHHATNRQIFVNGALQAANWLIDKGPGLYNMKDLF